MSIYESDRFPAPERGPLLPKVVFVGVIENWLWQWTIRSHEDLSKRYTLLIDFRDGTVSCSCPDFMCRRWKYRPTIFEGCKHVDDLCLEAARILDLQETKRSRRS